MDGNSFWTVVGRIAAVCGLIENGPAVAGKAVDALAKAQAWWATLTPGQEAVLLVIGGLILIEVSKK